MKPASILRALAFAALVLSPALAAAQAPVSAAAADEGKAHFQRAVALFHEGDFRAALVEFRRAYELSHNYKVLYNLGQTEYELQDYAGALRSFQRYLVEGGAEIDAARRASVEDDIKKLGVRVARVDVQGPAGAAVLVDDVVVGKTPLKEPVLVSIGRRKMTLQRDGVVSEARFVELAGGDRSSVTLELSERNPGAGPLRSAPPVSVASGTALAPASPPRTGMWVSLGITGALTGGAVVTGVLALGAHGDAQTKLAMRGVKAADVEAAHSKTATLALVTDIVGGAAVAMAGVTIALGVTGGRSSAAPPRAAVTVGPRGGVVSGWF